MQLAMSALALARASAGRSSAAKMAIMAITTSSSINVNPAACHGEREWEARRCGRGGWGPSTMPDLPASFSISRTVVASKRILGIRRANGLYVSLFMSLAEQSAPRERRSLRSRHRPAAKPAEGTRSIGKYLTCGSIIGPCTVAGIPQMSRETKAGCLLASLRPCANSPSRRADLPLHAFPKTGIRPAWSPTKPWWR